MTIKVATFSALLLAAAPLAAAAPIDGDWVTAEKNGVVHIGTCGATRCGRLARFLVVPPQGADQRDTNNPDAALRGRKLLGLAILSGFRPDGDSWKGTIYDPKRGKSYKSFVRRTAPGTLEVKGCIGPFCQTQVWTRAN